MSTTSITAPADAAGRWLTRFREKPLEALDGALTGLVHLGVFNTCRLRLRWEKSSLIPKGPSMGSCCAGSKRIGARSRYLTCAPGATRRALAEALQAVDLLGLSACRHWLREHAPADYRWLAALQVGGPATPLDALFATLATVQPDRALEPLGLRLSRLDGQDPVGDHGRVALAGLRLLPGCRPQLPGPGDVPVQRPDPFRRGAGPSGRGF